MGGNGGWNAWERVSGRLLTATQDTRGTMAAILPFSLLAEQGREGGVHKTARTRP